MRRSLLVLSVLSLSVGCDQATKHLATTFLAGTPPRSYFHDLFRIIYATNHGAFLSLGATLPPSIRFWFLTVTVGLVLVGLVVYALAGRALTSLQITGLGLVASGGLSNWIDRARHGGQVVDFLNVGIGSLRTGIFNVADVLIVAGVGCLMLAPRRAPSAVPSDDQEHAGPR